MSGDHDIREGIAAGINAAVACAGVFHQGDLVVSFGNLHLKLVAAIVAVKALDSPADVYRALGVGNVIAGELVEPDNGRL